MVAGTDLKILNVGQIDIFVIEVKLTFNIRFRPTTMT